MNMNRICRKNRRRPKKARQSPVQSLLETCKEIFANGGVGFIPPPHHLHRLRSLLDSLKSDDVGLSPGMPYFRAKRDDGAPVITYLHLYECDKFSMGIFCLPPSGVLPLHNHPGMTVFSKLLFGTMHIKSYDWVDNVPVVSTSTPPPPPPGATSHNTATSTCVGGGGEARLAKLKTNADFVAPCDTCILYPTTGGNMHCFTAVTPCAVLDVLGPPYSDFDGRHCTYYLDHPFHHFSVEGLSITDGEKEEHSWLQERDKPPDLTIPRGIIWRSQHCVVFIQQSLF